jgi:hypothetical protein
MREFENKIYSQNGEDGIISYIFENIGATNNVAVEIGVTDGGSGTQNNTRLLAENGWRTFWFDLKPPSYIPVNCKFSNKKLNMTNISESFELVSIPKEFDLLSIDIDSNDYYLREALSNYKPRVYIMEYNGFYNSSANYVMPYDENYVWSGSKRNFGASLLAYKNQADRLGYDLVYCEYRGINAFFIRKDLNPFKKKSIEELYVKLYKVKNEKNLLGN